MKHEAPGGEAAALLARAREARAAGNAAEAGRLCAALLADAEAGAQLHTAAHVDIAFEALLRKSHADADAHLRAALALSPADPRALYGMGLVEATGGQFERAAARFRMLLRRTPPIADAGPQLVSCRRIASAEDPDLALLRAALARGAGDRYAEEKLCFALARALDDCDEPAAAFEHARRANALKKARVASFDPAAGRAYMRRIAAVFGADARAAATGEDAGVAATGGDEKAAVIGERAEAAVTGADAAARGPRPGASPARPVFIVGMPRSGTTLVEQMLGAHSRVCTAGEQDVVDRATLGLLQPYPESCANIAPDKAARLRDAYHVMMRERLREKPAATCVTDKYPMNFLHLGLIGEVLPDARFIHCGRHPADTCLSIYFHDFRAGNLYANDLHDLAGTWRDYRELMDHWERCFPQRIFDCRYERLVGEPETVLRAMLSHLDLPFERACLDHTASTGNVDTLSRWQVRQPLYTRSVGRWRRYAPWIGPLLELEAEGEPKRDIQA